ncbi:NTPase KAP [Chitinibacter bivalviorum]|uniref:NTPase KAP n=1 Tax=Chitinibacter bivalviorum TaxID=2739434 RepID=A0A7H9BHL0_9NEIS|nr:P-loop NTPase fold protein [Chitinibacter bivalviorum]QLG88029.1 NTPase KAP [Chitinibacter bivalviorum]
MSLEEMMPSALDREISSADKDAFGHRHFAKALRSLIESENYSPPFSIGLLGGWGTGKSSIKELYTANLRDDASRTNKLTRKDRYHCITFNAWRFGGKDQDIKRALLRHVFLELGGSEESLQDKLFHQFSEVKETPKSVRQLTRELLRAWMIPMLALTLAVIGLFLLLGLGLYFLGINNPWAQALFIPSVAFVYTYVLKNVKPTEVKATNLLTKITFPSTTPEQYEEMLVKQIHEYKAGRATALTGQSGKTCERLVVFVDDLDRLPADEMVLGLDAVRTFMEIPKDRLPKGLGLVFVISCDEGKIADALAKGRRNADLPAAVFNHFDARRYLDRVFQFRLEITPPPRHDMRAFATSHLERMGNIAEDLKGRGFQLAPIIDRMIHVGIQDPRNALQIVNAFAQAWWLGTQREIEGAGTHRPGGLHEGAVTKHPISLGAICAFKVSFPDFYRDLQDDPAILLRFTEVLVQKRPHTGLPLTTQQLLIEKYLRLTEEDKYEIRPEHRALRQYLASLVGLRWANSLQSLLILSEDSITRQLGDKAPAIYDAFVSGDTDGVLEGMGRHQDISALTSDQARMLYQMFEDLRDESEHRRTNAAKVIADIIDRIPEPPAAQLLGELCREVADSLELRSQLGITRIDHLLEKATGKDQSSITSRLVDDVLTPGQQIKLLKESLDKPSLKEAGDMVKSLIPVVIRVAGTHELDNDAMTNFLKWLLDRSVGVDGKVEQLSFTQLEDWLVLNDEFLTQGLGMGYAKALADELLKAKPAPFDHTIAVNRALGIIEGQIARGEDSRRPAWVIVNQLITTNSIETVKAVCSYAIPNLDKAQDNEISKFVTGFIERLVLVAQDGKLNNDWTVAKESLVKAVSANVTRLDQNSVDVLANLVVQWSAQEANESAACAIANQLSLHHFSAMEKVVESWIPRLLTDLSDPYLELTAKSTYRLSETMQSSMVSGMNVLIDNEIVSEEASRRLELFVKHANRALWEKGPFHAYLDRMWTAIANRAGNPSRYLYRVFPSAVALLEHATPTTVGSSLQQLFAQAVSYPGHYSWLHDWMADDWPSNYPGFNPDPIFDQAVAFSTGQSPASLTKGIPRSLNEMLKRGLVDKTKLPQMLNTACLAWKTAPDDMASILAQHSELTIEQAVDLITTIDPEKEEDVSALKTVWSSLASKRDNATRQSIARQLLGKVPIASASTPDFGFSTWLQVQPDGGQELIKQLFEKIETSDEQTLRVWRQAVSRSAELGAEFYLTEVPKLLKLASMDITVGAVFDDVEKITATLGGQIVEWRWPSA